MLRAFVTLLITISLTRLKVHYYPHERKAFPLCESHLLKHLILMDKILIRKATSPDLEILLTFEQGIIETERPFDVTLKKGRISYYDLREIIAQDDAEIAVAELNGVIIASGYATIENSKPYLRHEKHAHLGFMFVSPLHRGKGINRLVIEFLKQWAVSKNIHELRLDVYFENTSAIHAYEKIGFSKHMIEMRMSI
jgi:GNAT superfamily N-acetyltransferase